MTRYSDRDQKGHLPVAPPGEPFCGERPRRLERGTGLPAQAFCQGPKDHPEQELHRWYPERGGPFEWRTLPTVERRSPQRPVDSPNLDTLQ